MTRILFEAVRQVLHENVWADRDKFGRAIAFFALWLMSALICAATFATGMPGIQIVIFTLSAAVTACLPLMVLIPVLARAIDIWWGEQ